MLALLAAALLAAQPPTSVAPSAPAPAAVVARYDEAMGRLLGGDLDGAAQAFAGVAADPTAGELAAPAHALAQACEALARRGRFVLNEPKLGARSSVDRSGRAELALFQTLYGIWSGVGLAIATEVDGRIAAGLAVAGGTLGLVASLAATRQGAISTGRASVIDSAATWGAFNGAMIGAAAGASGRASVATGVATGAAALIFTAMAIDSADVSAGDVALVNTGGTWGLVGAALSLAILEPSDRGTAAVLLVGADVGLVAMALTASRVKVSRGHALIIDAGGVLGTLVGLTIPLIANAQGSAIYGASGLAGMAVGLTLAAVASRSWEEDGTPKAHEGRATLPFVVPLAGGGLTAGIVGRF
jgi:hypothetical protein